MCCALDAGDPTHVRIDERKERCLLNVSVLRPDTIGLSHCLLLAPRGKKLKVLPTTPVTRCYVCAR